VDSEQLDRSFVGRSFDRSLLADLSDSVDRCAENGEFHTAVIAGPMFRGRLNVEVGLVVERGRFVCADLSLPGA
jgi:diphthamide synthase (EF-2-diphthine--ammonia ligase)